MSSHPPKSLSEVIREIGRGTADSDATQAIREVVSAVQQTGKGGSVTVTVKVTPPKGGGGTHLEVAAEVTAKVPRLAPVPSIYFRDPVTGDLTRSDPDQYEMHIDTTTGEIQ